MKNITPTFQDVYMPVKALLIYERNVNEQADIYVESYDIDDKGSPVNAHPLDGNECAALAKCLDQSEELRRDFLTPKGLLPKNVIYINAAHDGCVLWYTHAQEVPLFFKEELSIPSGNAHIPALLWKATRDELHLYALKDNKPVIQKTKLYNAPFFNIHPNGSVCMGTVDVQFDRNCQMEDFISGWQQYFFNSYFSHLIGGHTAVKGNIVQLWQQQVTTGRPFPTEQLVPASITVKNLIR